MQLVIAGTGGHSESVFNLAKSLDHEVVGFLDDVTDRTNWNGIPVFKNTQSIGASFLIGIVVAVGNVHLRERIVREIQATSDRVHFPNLVHPSAVVSTSVTMGIGTVVMPFAYIGPKSTIGDFCVINTHSSIEHNSNIGSYVSISPGVIMGGCVTVQDHTFIGIGSKITDKINIGKDSVIGAGSLLNKNLPNNVVAYGSPAVVIRENL